jgi:hypothetical protein
MRRPHFNPRTIFWYSFILGADIVDGCGTMLQAGRSQARVPMRSFNVFNVLNPSSRTMSLPVTQKITMPYVNVYTLLPSALAETQCSLRKLSCLPMATQQIPSMCTLQSTPLLNIVTSIIQTHKH